jgi:hypothetical protein
MPHHSGKEDAEDRESKKAAQKVSFRYSKQTNYKSKNSTHLYKQLRGLTDWKENDVQPQRSRRRSKPSVLLLEKMILAYLDSRGLKSLRQRLSTPARRSIWHRRRLLPRLYPLSIQRRRYFRFRCLRQSHSVVGGRRLLLQQVVRGWKRCC